jgi:zinc transport system ATP-binding protein
VGYVPQFASFSRDFPISVEQTILLGRMGRTRTLFGWTAADRRAVSDVMTLTDIRDLKDRRLGALSGGQIQKVFIARALAADPEILILDEPTANIDLRVEENIFDLLREINQRVTILVVSHDIGFISKYVSRVACLNRTLMCHQTQALGGELIRELYGAPVQMIHHHH